MVASFRNFHGKIWVGFCLNIGKHFFLSFHFKANRNSMPSVWEIGMFLCDNQLKFQTFSILNFETNFLENKNLEKNWSTVFRLKPLRLKIHHFHSKVLCQKPILRQIEWRLQNGPFTKNGVLPVTSLFFWKICSSFRSTWPE